MNITRLIIASVMTHSVFERFAQLSEDDKDAVVSKVKDKVKSKNTETTDEDAEMEDVGSSEKATKLISDNAEEETSTDKGVEEKESTEGGLDNIVGDLMEEIEVIKSDGKVSPSEVLGLIDNVVQMVQVLLQAKPGKLKKSSMRKSVIVDRLVQRVCEGG